MATRTLPRCSCAKYVYALFGKPHPGWLPLLNLLQIEQTFSLEVFNTVMDATF
ncbi:hypothetical protein KSZ_03540 [Dictyobacter formicarum]|uniref:Uncharacterized protein n=1 Tax=Dictyobacter formicarum TaxID=2778368 RepID=A0ABQ3V942_9CHLR|nr:hypothetical protein KSZ_03540 [Dictyobacter formicarum]